MAITYPLSLAAFFDAGIVKLAEFELGEAYELSETAGGEILAAQRGNRLWAGSLAWPDQNARAMAPLRSTITLLRQPGATFHVADVAMRFPAADPTGSVLSGTTPFVASREVSDRKFTLGGVPTGYTVTPGDHLSIAFGAGNARRAYFEVVAGATAVGTTVGPIQVEPPIPQAVEVGDVVHLLNPHLKAIVRPGTVQGGRRSKGRVAAGYRLDWVQTLG